MYIRRLLLFGGTKKCNRQTSLETAAWSSSGGLKQTLSCTTQNPCTETKDCCFRSPRQEESFKGSQRDSSEEPVLKLGARGHSLLGRALGEGGTACKPQARAQRQTAKAAPLFKEERRIDAFKDLWMGLLSVADPKTGVL